jgi:DNA-binding transcriptional MerR regulator
LTLYRGTAPTLSGVETYTIGQLADDAGVNIETIRYYERLGLLRDPPRSNSGYRQYSTDDLWQLQFIARAKQLGFTLAEVSSLVEPEDRSSAESVVLMARAKIRSLDDERERIDETRSRLTRLIDLCEDPTSPDCTALRVTL